MDFANSSRKAVDAVVDDLLEQFRRRPAVQIAASSGISQSMELGNPT
jgi:hypothetical protein